MPVVVVESPAKAKTINKYLGSDYKVLASYGHIRDLSSKEGSVDPDNNFEMVWDVPSTSTKHIKAIVDALKNDDRLILATDPDREGEAISWHLLEVLAKKKAIKKDTKVERVAFNQITKNAVADAIAHPRQIDRPLVDAYLARRALDYLVGYNLSPILWRKLPGARSAGRVQSVALRIVVEREAEIDAFTPVEYWSVAAKLETPRGDMFDAKLVALDGKKLGKEDLGNEEAAHAAVAKIRSAPIQVEEVEAKPAQRHPSPPFMTSTLQQEASRKFGMGARQTMSAAQRLYEAGYITYMRTDGINMANEAISAARAYIQSEFGKDYLPESPKYYKNKAKNAQEAHECIRPTDLSLSPEKLGRIEADQAKLYGLIWKRAIASQMSPARFERTAVQLVTANGQASLRANGQVLLFDGFLKVYFEGREDQIDEDNKSLPLIRAQEPMGAHQVTPEQHFTQPPPRYSEASLIQKMEELGIGRPSTYASIVSTIQDREYVRKEQNRLIPNDKGKLVIMFLENYFPRYVSYDFTADLEEDLDRVSNGDEEYDELLLKFWTDFKAAIEETTEVRVTDVIDRVNELFGPEVFPEQEDGSNPRLCPSCQAGELSIRLAKNGEMFIGCSNYPDCRYTRSFKAADGDDDINGTDGKYLGEDNGDAISLRSGRFGPYVQRGQEGEDGAKPPRSSVPKGMDLSTVNLEKAIALLSLPRFIGNSPEDGEPIEASIGRYGPYVRHGKTYANIKDPEEVFTIGINRAVELIAQKQSRGGGRTPAKPLRVLGEHPDGGDIGVYDGRYGPYVKWEKINATIPKTADPDTIGFEEALELVNAKAAAKGKKKVPAKKKTATKKTTAKKTATKKAPAKKPAPKKTPAKDEPLIDEGE